MAPQLNMQGQREFLEHTFQLINNRAEKSSKFLEFICISKAYRWTSRYYGSSIYRLIIESSSKSMVRLSSKSSNQSVSRASFGLEQSKVLRLLKLLKPALIQFNFSAGNTSFLADVMDQAPGKLAIKFEGYADGVFELLTKHSEKVAEVYCDVLHLPEDACLPAMNLDRLELYRVKSFDQLRSLLNGQVVKKLKLSLASSFEESENNDEQPNFAVKELEIDIRSFDTVSPISQVLSIAQFPELKRLQLKAQFFEKDFETYEDLNLDRIIESVRKHNSEMQKLAAVVETLSCKVDCGINFTLFMKHKEPATDVEQQLKEHLFLRYSNIKVLKNKSQSTVDFEITETCGPLNFTLRVSSKESN